MNPKYHLLVAAAALSLCACTKDDTHTETVPENRGYKISFTIAEDSETRTTLDKDNEGKDILRWVSADRVGIYTANGGGKCVNINALSVPYISYRPVTFISSLENPVSSGDKFYAYYPYNEAQSADPARATLTIPAEQTQTEAGVYNGQTQPLVAVPMDFQWEHSRNTYNINNVHFRLLGAIVELQLYSSDKALHGEKIQSVAFESDSPLAGDFTFNLKTVTETGDLPITGYESRVAMTTLEKSAAIPAEDGKALVYQTIAPGTYTGRIVVQTDVAQYTFPLAEPMTFKRAVIKGLPADLAGATRVITNFDAAIPFKDDEVKRICLENWDKDNDGNLSYHEAAAVTSIGTRFNINTSISSFDELQYFTKLKSIGETAFYGCSSLTSINIPDGVTAIGRGAFFGCSNLASITIPDGVTTIGQLAFYSCTSLTSVTIPQTVTSISGGAFAGCFLLSAFSGKYATEDKCCLIQDGTLLAFAQAGQTKYTIPAEVTKIGERTFEFCIGLTSIHLPDGVTAIGDYAFNSCINLTSINIPNGVTAIGISALANCNLLTSINIPEGVTVIEKYTFADCSSLKSITIPDEVTKIGERAFYGCSDLTSSITIPNKVTEIKDSTFGGCGKLTSIQLPDGLTKIEDYAFRGCGSLKSITIPNKVTVIGKSVFDECSSLESIQLSNSLTMIESSTFLNCKKLTSITIPNKVTEIGNRAFESCSALKSIQLSNELTTIGSDTFKNCSSLESITIPDKVITIGQYCFRSCSELKSVYCKPTVPPALDIYVFNETSKLLQIYVPTASVQAYEQDDRWGAFPIVADNSSTGK